MKVTIKEIKELCPKKGKEEVYFLARYFYRPLSIYFTYVFANLSLSANTVTFLSLVSSLISCYFLLFNDVLSKILAVLFMQLYFILDHCDGNLHRLYVQKSRTLDSKDGDFFDYLVHQYSANLMMLFMSFGLYKNVWASPLVVLGGVAAFLGLSNIPHMSLDNRLMRRLFRLSRDITLDEVKKIQQVYYKFLFYGDKGENNADEKTPYAKQSIISQLLFFPGVFASMSLSIIIDTVISLPVAFRLIYLFLQACILLLNMIRLNVRIINVLKTYV